ncbi:MAG: penicillin acylase family protein [Cyclobacteriaceae bacterium]|jgi:penicillin amidase|nr:penicillin acylase family protein [Cyclobacteriaceae bacterium]
MKIVIRILIALVALLLITGLFVFGYLQTLKPQLHGELNLPGLKGEVEVYFDNYGVPHIYAQHEEDAYYALGYVHAQDRLFQMEMLRRAAGGRLAEILGEDLVKVDKLFRTMGLNQFAREHARKYMSSDTAAWQRAALAYQNGINHYIKTGKTPIEFSIIGIPKTEFTPEDLYLAVGFMSFGFAEGFNADPVLETIRTEWGENYLADLALVIQPDAEHIANYNGNPKPRKNEALTAAITEALDNMPVPLWQGSNGWVISAEKSATGSPILSNDTHIGFSQPAVWYEAHIEYPGYRFYGHHLAGIPFGLLGNNQFCGVGLTMFENDDVDFFRESANPDNTDEVKFKDAYEPLQKRNEVIKVKGKPDVILEVKSSRHGPIMNGIGENTGSFDDPIALSWQLLMMDNFALQAAYRLNHATDFETVQQAVSMFTAPGLNVMYGDTVGNIAWWASARLPVRASHVNSKVFQDGASGADEYLGYYSFDKNPKAVNPPWGFVYSANNQPDTVDDVLYPGYYYPRSRAERIHELLRADKKFTIEEIKEMMLDVTSNMNADIAHDLAGILEASSEAGAFTVIINELKNWNGEDHADRVAPSIYYTLLSNVIFQAMEDEIGNTALSALLKTSVLKNAYRTLITNETSPWWDDIHTKEVTETREIIVVHAAEHTLESLTAICGKKSESWTWSNLHTLTHPHALGAVKPLDKFFNVGPFAVSGGSEVINNLQFRLNESGRFPVDAGPALRKITQFGDIENGMTVSPTGQSGNIMSPHYSDQAAMFASGQFRKMMMNREEIVSTTKNRLLLRP